MSDSHFIDEKLAEFRRKHPLSDGWLTYRIAPHASSVSHALLPAFLRSHAPGAVVREEVSPSIDWDSGKSGRRQSLLTPPLHRRGAGIDEETWVGEIDFVWKNTPVHYQRFSLVMRFGEEPSTLIATKDRDALEDLWRELKAFERRFNSRTSCIYIFQEGPIPRPKLGWDDVVLPTGRIEEIRDSVRSFLKAKPLYKELNLPFRRGFLFSGPPGCGKTLTAKIIAANTKVGIFLLPLKSDIDDATLARAFRMPSEEGPAILILEDLDRLQDGTKVSLSYLLNLLDGITAPDGLIVIATTNAPEKLDPALLNRPSRFDKVWHFGLPGEDERLRLLRKKGLGRFGEAALRRAARDSHGFSMAYVQETAVAALLHGVNEGRPSRDTDLTDSVAKLRSQLDTNFKADGALKPLASVGFAVPSGNGAGNGASNGNGKKDLPKGIEAGS